MSVRIVRAFFIRKILETRFREGPALYTEVMRERERLEAASTDELEAELAAMDQMPMAPIPDLPSS